MVIGVSIVANPITPILIPFGKLKSSEAFWLGKKFGSPFSDFKFATRLELFLFLKKANKKSDPKSNS